MPCSGFPEDCPNPIDITSFDTLVNNGGLGRELLCGCYGMSAVGERMGDLGRVAAGAQQALGLLAKTVQPEGFDGAP